MSAPSYPPRRENITTFEIHEDEPLTGRALMDSKSAYLVREAVPENKRRAYDRAIDLEASNKAAGTFERRQQELNDLLESVGYSETPEVQRRRNETNAARQEVDRKQVESREKAIRYLDSRPALRTEVARNLGLLSAAPQSVQAAASLESPTRNAQNRSNRNHQDDTRASQTYTSNNNRRQPGLR